VSVTETVRSTTDDLLAPFADVVAELAETAAARDDTRTLPFAQVAELARRGLWALRVPVSHGGRGASFAELTRVLVAVAEADPNVVQALRSHVLFTEAIIAAPDSPDRDRWLRRIAGGAVLGGAHTERNPQNTDHFGTTVTTGGDGVRRVDGVKYYSTGSLYADWIVTNAEADDDRLETLVVAADAPGVTRVDDWDGFGQQLTASGTTRFEGVVVDEAEQLHVELGSEGTSLAQHLHLVALAGIARAVHRDVVAFVRDRRRWFAQSRGELPRHDAQVQEVVGELSTTAYLAETVVADVARALDALRAGAADGSATPADEDTVELRVYRAQVLLVRDVPAAATRLFDVGGASALSRSRRLDRHWRNARTLATHNPIPYRLSSIGDHDLNGTSPFRAWFSGVDLRGRAAQG